MYGTETQNDTSGSAIHFEKVCAETVDHESVAGTLDMGSLEDVADYEINQVLHSLTQMQKSDDFVHAEPNISSLTQCKKPCLN